MVRTAPFQGANPGSTPGSVTRNFAVRNSSVKHYFVYVLRSLKDKDLYIGVSDNLKRRVIEHNSGLEISTKFRRPF